MYLINGKEIDLREATLKPELYTGQDNDVVRFILDKVEKGRDKLPARFVWDSKYGEANPYDKKHIEYPASVGVVLTADYIPPKGMVTSVTYYERVLTDEKGRKTYVLNDGNTYLDFTGNLTINRDREELAVYLFALLEGDFKLTTNARTIPYMYVDKNKIAKTEQDASKEKFRILKLVYEEITPKVIKSVAKNLGISGADEMTEPELRVQIEKMVNGNPVNEKLVRECLTPNPSSDLRVEVQDALDAGFIKFTEVGTTIHYSSYVNDKEDRQLLVKGKKTAPIDALTDFFSKNETEQEYLKTLNTQ
jgi:hypothetical protein